MLVKCQADQMTWHQKVAVAQRAEGRASRTEKVEGLIPLPYLVNDAEKNGKKLMVKMDLLDKSLISASII